MRRWLAYMMVWVMLERQKIRFTFQTVGHLSQPSPESPDSL